MRLYCRLYSTASRPFNTPQSKNGKPGKIGVKEINHYGDEVLKVYQYYEDLSYEQNSGVRSLPL